ncbi:ankyrin repeat domain-containing protein 12 isoform X1 [Hypomesus transpacificus]|uniref:ankyrin repeat domain-containing protein 12 isoform X1 n=1 Tax=Hypomesus transpacificus TaxID=137520 RepID=UPI001F0790DE|nr:ankyrin repeat domain-containing protein 12 isoform X1 [Hypomesus transpacificus]XP_046884006.1 ankyrin repeat domain-containing protein 12 isoform X1 [Hypomesus transpacificus]
MAKPGSDRDGAMVDKQAGKKSKDKISPFTKTPKLDRSEVLGKEGKPKSSMKRKLSFTASPPRAEERDSDTDDSDPGQSSETWGERLVPPCRIYADKDGPDKKKVKKESGSKKSSASANLLFGYPLSERKQMALLMQMTARDNSPDSTPSHPSQTPPVQKKAPSSTTSRQKDKVNKRNERGETPLHMAAIRGDAKQVKELISLGADVNVKDFAGWTPLHEACNLGYYDVAKVLLAAGAEVNTQGLDDDTPLHDASSSGHKNILKLLLRHGGNAFQANKRGERPVDVADSLELEQLLKGEVPLSDSEDSSSESEDPPSVNPSSVDDDNMEDSDADKDSDDKQTTVKASSSMSGLDEYEFKDEEEEEDLSKALNDRHILRRELRQREKEEKERNHFTAKQSSKGGDASGQSGKSKKQRTQRVLCCSSDSSSDEMENPSERRSSPTCSQSADARSKKDNLSLPAEQRDKGKMKRKSKSLSKNKENQEDGKENSKALVFSVATVTESTDKSRDEDSFKMSFSPKDESSVHLFHLSSVKSPKVNHSLTDKQSTPLKQENAKMCLAIGEGPCQVDAVKYIHYTEQDYCTESTSSKGCKHKEKSKHHQRDLNVDGEDGGSSPYKEVGTSNSVDSGDGALRKTDKDGKVVKKHKIKYKEKDKHRREYEAERSRHRQKEGRKDGHRNLEFDREFWKENFFKSDENDEPLPVKKEPDDGGSPQKTSDASPAKEERGARDKHSGGGKDKRPREEKDKALKKERKESAGKEERGKDVRPSERDERPDCHGSGRIPEESLHHTSMKEEPEDKPITGIPADQDQLESSEKGSREKYDKRLPVKEKEVEKFEKRHPDKEKKVKVEHSEKSEPQNVMDRLKEKERIAGSLSHLPGDKNHRESEKLRSIPKKHDESKKIKDKDRKSDRERQEREYSAGEHREKDRTGLDKRGKPPEKTIDHSKSDRSKEKECEKKRKDKMKESSSSSGSNLKLLLEEKKGYVSESGRSVSTKTKEEVIRTPEKERDRRDRDREKDSERHRDRDKERHRDRSQPGKVSKSKPNEAEGDRAKSKSSPATRDSRPKEKRLVNDDLMQTSFERMLSLKDQEIEQWHRKHLEKIKQKERERMKQRPSTTDPGKVKSKDKAKTEPCMSKELLRSKSSESSEPHGREKPLKDGTTSRTLSLDGKSLSAVSGKVIAGMENSLSRSPRPESERSGLMSRSVSMVSVASSEDSCQATTLTPRPVEYDSDLTLEASDSQPPFLQSSLVLQATRSPVVQDKDNSLPDVTQCNRTPLPSRHTSLYLRAILDEDANSASVEGKPFESLPKAVVPGHTNEEPVNAHTSEISADTEESHSGHHLTPPNILSAKSDVDANSESDVNIPGVLPPPASAFRDAKEPLLPLISLSQSDVPQPAVEHRGPPPTDHLQMQEVKCVPTGGSVDGEGSHKDPPSVDVPLVSAASLSSQTPPSSNTKTSAQLSWQQNEATLNASVEMFLPAEADVDPGLDQKDDTPLESGTSSADSREVQELMESVPAGCRTDRMSSPLPSTSTQMQGASSEESSPSKTAVEPTHAQEDMEMDSHDCKTSRDSSDVAGPCSNPQVDNGEHVRPPSSCLSSCVSPEHKTEEMTDSDTQSMESRSRNAEVTTSVKENSSEECIFIPESGPERAEPPCPEPMDVSAAEERPEPSGGGEQSQSGGQHAAHADLSGSSASGSSSPQSGDRDSDSSGAKAKVRSLDEEMDMQVTHPRKRKMPRMSLSSSSSSSSQACPTTQQENDKPQQSLAAIVDSVKLEEIQPYQTERANPYYDFLHIRKKIEEKRKVLCSVIPQPPQYYDEYVTFNGSYLLDGNPLSKLCIPTITPPPSLPDQLKEMFKQQEVVRMKLRLQHSIEREKLIVSNEQEVLRVHYRAARTLANQTLPFSACTVLLDAEVYNMPQDVQASGMMSHSVESGDDGKTSVRDRFNARQFMSWLQDVDDKFDKLKTCLLMRQQHEAAALNAVQRLEWQLKLQELDPATYKSTSIFEISEFHIPLVEVNDDFDLTPI